MDSCLLTSFLFLFALGSAADSIFDAGDIMTLTFDVDTNTPAVDSGALLTQLLRFSPASELEVKSGLP